MYTKEKMLSCGYQLRSFGKSVRYEVLSFACLSVNKVSWVQGGVATSLSC